MIIENMLLFLDDHMGFASQKAIVTPEVVVMKQT